MENHDHGERPPKGVPWRDLADVTPRMRLGELFLPLPWLALSLALYASPLWPLGALGSFMFFLCALRLNHEAIHSNLGLDRAGDSIVLHVLSMLMLGSNHAVAHGHMIHHRHVMGPEDFEGKCGHMSALQVLFYGPRFMIDIIRHGWTGGTNRTRRRMLIDALLVAAMLGTALLSGSRALLLHVAAMAVAQCLTAFFAVWITHQGTAGRAVAARSQRGIWARAAYLMFYHREHHLFPKVPVSRLPELAARLDRDVPGYAASRLPVIPLFDRERSH